MAWLGALPAGAFAQKPMGQMQTATEPFVWKGGRRMTPEDIAVAQRMAMGKMAAGSDTSPLQHWTQGLNRVAQGVLGGMEMGALEDASRANAAEGDAVARALLEGGDRPDLVAAAMMDPNLPQPVRDFAELRFKQMNPTPPQPTEFERAVLAAGIQRGTPEYQSMMRDYATNKANPLQAVPGVDEQGNQILRFIRPSAMGGGDPIYTGPVGAMPPKTLPPDFDFGEGGPTPSASGGFR